MTSVVGSCDLRCDHCGARWYDPDAFVNTGDDIHLCTDCARKTIDDLHGVVIAHMRYWTDFLRQLLTESLDIDSPRCRDCKFYFDDDPYRAKCRSLRSYADFSKTDLRGRPPDFGCIYWEAKP